MRIVRYERNGKSHYGIIEKTSVREVEEKIFCGEGGLQGNCWLTSATRE